MMPSKLTQLAQERDRLNDRSRAIGELRDAETDKAGKLSSEAKAKCLAFINLVDAHHNKLDSKLCEEQRQIIADLTLVEVQIRHLTQGL